MKTTKYTLLIALALALAATALPAAAQADFTKFVAIGASGDSGFMDSCWVKHGQIDSWPAIFARQAGIPDSNFQQPLLDEPGLGSAGIGPKKGCQVLLSLAPTFDAKESVLKPLNLTLARPYDNLAIPGYLASSIVNCKTAVTAPTDPLYVPCNNALIDLVLRGSGATVLQQAASLKPTFLAVGFLGNELLGPASKGTIIDGVTLLPTAAYAASYKTILDTMKAAQGGTGKGIVLNNADITNFAYFKAVSPIIGVNPADGSPIYVLGPTGCPSGAPACPVPAGTLVPLPLATLMKAGYGIPCAVNPANPNCNKPLPDNAGVVAGAGYPGLIYPAELTLWQSRKAEYNAQIKTLAEADGYKVFDLDAFYAGIAAKGVTFGAITLTSSYLSGGLFSYDGIHATSIGYAVEAEGIIQFVNAQYGTSIPLINFYPYLTNGNSQAGGFPTSAFGPPTQEEIRDYAAAYFTPEVLEGFWKTMGVADEAGSIVLGDGTDDLPVPAVHRTGRAKLVD